MARSRPKSISLESQRELRARKQSSRMKKPVNKNAENFWNRLWCYNCFNSFEDLFSWCFFKSMKVCKNISIEYWLKYNLPKLHFGEIDSFLLIFIVFNNKGTNIYSACILKICKAVAKPLSKWQRFYLLMFQLKSAPSKRYFVLPLLYQTHLWINLKASTSDQTEVRVLIS